MARIFRSHCGVGERTAQRSVPTLPDFKPDILRLNGKPTIYQMRQFSDWAQAHGFKPPSPESLLDEYSSALDALIAGRVKELHSGHKRVEEFLVFGVGSFLAEFARRSVRLVILSGSLEHRVREEAQWLGVAGYFGRHIYGSPEHGTGFSKRSVLERLVAEENLKRGDLVAFGDGPVEIEETKRLGGLAIGVASDEDEHCARGLDPVKRELLAEAGADILVADFRESKRLCQEIFGPA